MAARSKGSKVPSTQDGDPPSGSRPPVASGSAGDGLILGWREFYATQFGFAGSESKPEEPPERELLRYNGEGHAMTIASTGSGKGRGVLIPNLLKVQQPVIVIDPKGENYDVTARARRAMGHTVVKLDPFGWLDAKTDRLNPFDIFNLPGVDLESEAQLLSNMMSLQLRGIKDPFWDEHGTGYLSGLIASVVASKPPEERHLDSVFSLLMGDDPSYGTAVMLDNLGAQLPKMACRELASFLSLPERETRGSVLATTNSYTKPLLSEAVLRTLRDSSFALEDIAAGKPLDVFLVIPSDKLRSHRGLLRLWVGTLLKAITSRKEIPEHRTLFMIDECAQLEEFAFLETIITLCRGYGLQCWTFWQDLAQLRTYYPRSWETLINNCGVLQVFGVRNFSVATQLAAFFNLSSDELLKMGPYEQRLLFPGQGVVKARLCDYLNDGEFRGLWDTNRFFGRAA